MIGTAFASLVRYYTRTNSTTLADADIVLLANTVKDDFAKEIIKADEDLFGVVADTDLRASDTDDFTQREYPLPADNLGVKKLEAKLDGTNWVDLIKFDLSKWKRPTTEAEVIASFGNAQGNAYWDKFRNSIWIYSGDISAAVTDGLKIHYIAYPSDIDATDLAASTDLSTDPSTTESSLPKQFHELWARKISIIWKSSRDKPIPLSERELVFDKDFQKAIDAIENIDEADIKATLPNDEVYQY